METTTEKINPEEAVAATEKHQAHETSKTGTEMAPEESKEQQQAENQERDSAQPEWLVNELNSLNSLKTKFSVKYKKVFKKVEACQNEEECLSLTNDMYLELMQRVFKTAGTDRGTVILEKLLEKRDQIESSVSGTQEKDGGT